MPQQVNTAAIPLEQQARASRLQMVERDLIQRGLTDPQLVAAFTQVPRHHFVDASLKFQAYQPSALPIYGQQSISQPYVVALMTSQLKLTPHSKVLDVGTGSGYQAAILSRLCQRVYAVERLPALVQAAKQRFDELNYHNIVVKLGDGFEGWPEFAPYDAILVAACAAEFPEKLYQQLKPGGRLVMPMGDDKSQELFVWVRQTDTPRRISLGACAFVPLVKGK